MNRFFSFLLGFFYVSALLAGNGTFIIVKNSVNIQRKSGNQEVAKVGSTVSPGDTVISGVDSRAKIAMQDRNIITILPNTKLVIEEYKSSNNEKNVRLSLLEGKVRNDVKEKYDNDKNKFQIRTPTAVAGVRGTKFITAFAGDTKITEVITLKGEVIVTKFDFEKNVPIGSVAVNQGEKAIIENDAKPPSEPINLEKRILREIDQESTAKKDPASQNGKSNTDPNSNLPPPPPPKPAASPTEGITQPNQLPPFLINNPNTAPGKVKPELKNPTN